MNLKTQCLSSVIRFASIARRYLIEARILEHKIPLNAQKALLMVTEAEYYLEQLEKCNFDAFNSSLNRFSRVVVPYRMQKASRKHKIILYLK
jgi:hypothetical protein